MKEFVGYIFFDKTRDYESAFSINPHWADDDEDWYLGGTVKSLQDVWAVLENHGFDAEYIYNFFNFDLTHDEYAELKSQDKTI